MNEFYTCLMNVRDKLLEITPNVLIGESLDLLSLSDSDFPRFEIRPLSGPGKGRPSQREVNRDFIIVISGYIKRSSEEVTDNDVLNITDMGETLRTAIFGFIDDAQASNPPCSNFTGIDPYFELDYDWELFGNISTCHFGFRVEVYQNDITL